MRAKRLIKPLRTTGSGHAEALADARRLLGGKAICRSIAQSVGFSSLFALVGWGVLFLFADVRSPAAPGLIGALGVGLSFGGETSFAGLVAGSVGLGSTARRRYGAAFAGCALAIGLMGLAISVRLAVTMSLLSLIGWMASSAGMVLRGNDFEPAPNDPRSSARARDDNGSGEDK